MLSYEHHYHAGNHADVLKHWVLIACLAHLQRKAAGFTYVDTHAGAGRYDLADPRAVRLREADAGIRRLAAEPVPGMESYLERVSPHLACDRYPGSALLVRELLRPQDTAWLFELHPQVHRELEQHCAVPRQVHVRKTDGFAAVAALLPVPTRRVLVLVDPSYELKEDDVRVVALAEGAQRREPGATVVVWYPVVDRRRVRALEARVRRAKLRDVLQLELLTRDDDAAGGAGMTGSGMLVVGPPWTLEAAAQRVLPALAERLSADGNARAAAGSRWRVTRLVPEAGS